MKEKIAVDQTALAALCCAP